MRIARKQNAIARHARPARLGRGIGYAAALAVAVALVVVGAPRGAIAQPLPDDMRPMVFVLLDSSMSMEWSLNADNVFPSCPEPAVPGFEYTKNRWLVAMEVLTGTFEGLSCRTDLRTPADDPDNDRDDIGWPFEHIAWSWTNQKQDGLLDVLQDEITFGLMTFDPKAGPSVSRNDGYSYFHDGPAGEYLGRQVDLGIKNSTAARGGLVHPSTKDAVDDLRVVNQLIQDRILANIPYGSATPGPAFADIAAYLEFEPSQQPREAGNPHGDPFGACRPKYVVFVSQGRFPDFTRFGYPFTPAEYAARLRSEFGVKTYVVGFDVSDPSYIAALNAIADAGDTGDAYIANNQTQLVSQLATILSAIQTGVDSRTEPLVTNVTRNEPEDKQYRFWSARIPVAGNPVDREGIIEWETWACRTECQSESNDGSIDLCAIDDIGKHLVGQAAAGDRRIHTVLTDPVGGGTFTLEPMTLLNPALTAEALNVPTVDDYPQVAMFHDGTDFTMPFGHLIFEEPNGIVDPLRTQTEKRAEYARQLVSYVLADVESRRPSAPLGGIYRANLAIQSAPPRWFAPMPSYQLYATAQMDRPNVLYTATHDGVFHAFRVDRSDQISLDTGTAPGQELWGFIPNFALRKLHLLDDTFVQLLDGTPNVAEVLPIRQGIDADPVDEAEDWMTVAVVPAGSFGRGIFALDVTDPVQWRDTMFLWELTPEGRCTGPGTGTCTPAGDEPESDFSKLGYTIARPAIGTVFTTVDLVPKERTVAFFAGGDDPDDEGIGRVFYVVDIETGKKIVEFSDEAGNVFGGTSGAKLDEFPLVGTPTAYSSAIGQFVTRIFVGDAGGRMWRIQIDSPDPSEWRMDLFDDAYAGLAIDDPLRAPIWLAPTVAASRERGRLVVVYATGNVDQQGPDPMYTLHSLIEERVDETTVRAAENWRYTFPAGEQPVGRPLIFNKTVYFASYVASIANLCQIGTSRIWGVDYTETAGGAPVPRIDVDSDPLTIGEPALYVEYPDTLITSLQIIREPSCLFELDFSQSSANLPPGMFEGADGGAPGGGAPGLGGMRLVAQQAGNPSPGGQSQPAGATLPGQVDTSRIAKQDGIPIAAPANQVVIESWATIFD